MFEKLLWIPFLIQIPAMSFDEFYFHWKRGLPRWERVGHPLDTLSVIILFLFSLFTPFARGKIGIFVALAILSCLLVTKDEWVHKHHCAPTEQWLHALLFINHPLLIISLGILWGRGQGSHPFIWIQTGMTFCFCLYQILYWNVIWKENR